MAMIKVLREQEYGRRNCKKDSAWKSSILKKLHSNSSSEFEIQTQTDGSSIPPMACEYSPNACQSNLVAVADEDGGVNIYDSSTNGMKQVQSWLAHENAVFDVAWDPRGPEMLTASGDLSLRLWDVGTKKCVRQYCRHEASVKCVCYNPYSPDIFASGSRDGHIVVWDKRHATPAAVIAKSHQTCGTTKRKAKTQTNKGVPPSMSVTDCVFRDSHHLISCGATNGTVKVWDLRKNYSLFTNEPKPAHSFPYAGGGTAVHGYTSLTLDAHGMCLYANCTDRCIYRFNVSTYPPEPTCMYYGHRVRGSFYIKLSLSPDGQFLLGGSADRSAYVWNVDAPGYPDLQLDGHTTEVTSISWNKFDFTKIATCGDDNKVVFWDCVSAEERGSPYVCSPFVASESTPKPQWSVPSSPATPNNRHQVSERNVQTPHSTRRPRSVADWLTPPSKRRFVGEDANGLLQTSECTTPRSHHRSTPEESSTPASLRSKILSPKKVDNGYNLPQRRLTLDFLDEKLTTVEDGENSLAMLETFVTPPRTAPGQTPPSAQLSKKKHKAKMCLFRKSASRPKSQAKRELLQSRTITSFFKR